MAERVPIVCGGLNDISDLATSDQHEARWIPYPMEKSNSRIPKLSFGFRKPALGKPGHLSEGNSPRGAVTTTDPPVQPPARPMTPSDSHSAPGSQNTSPNLSRSKSLRAPKSSYHAVKIQPNPTVPSKNHTGNGHEETSPRLQGRPKLRPSVEVADDKVESHGLSRARSKTMGSGIARPSLRSSGRPMSPRVAWQGRERGVDVEQQEEEEDEEYFTGSPQPGNDLSPLKRDRRTKSFSAKTYTKLTNGTSPSTPSSPSHSAAANTPMARANSMRRSKTPTSLTSSIRSHYGGERAGNSSNGVQGEGMVRTVSQGHVGKFNAKITPSTQQKDRVPMRRAVSSSKPPRPLSSYMCEESSPGCQGDDETGAGEKGLKGKRSHSSMDNHHISHDATSTPGSHHTGSGRITPTRTSRFLAVKHRTNSLENSGGSSNSSSRPRSATAHYQQARRLSNANKETAASKPELSTEGRRDSTPISGRSTPVSKGASRDSTDGGVVSTPAKSIGLPPRTPYRVARTKAAPSNNLAGMNELEGSVLLEADDYRRLVNEVKALKTALLKLKRELQEGSEEPATPTQAVRSKTAPTTPGQMTPADQSKKLRALGKERDAATDEVSRLKKELKSRDSRMENLTREVAELREKNKQSEEELKCVSENRNRLVDKVERLHAEKHQIEARLNTLERASMYEQTWSENWLDELDGEDNDVLRRSLENDNRSFSEGGRTKGSSGSDVGDSGMQSDGDVDENSEPEGVAISYTGPAVM